MGRARNVPSSLGRSSVPAIWARCQCYRLQRSLVGQFSPDLVGAFRTECVERRMRTLRFSTLQRAPTSARQWRHPSRCSPSRHRFHRPRWPRAERTGDPAGQYRRVAPLRPLPRERLRQRGNRVLDFALEVHEFGEDHLRVAVLDLLVLDLAVAVEGEVVALGGDLGLGD